MTKVIDVELPAIAMVIFRNLQWGAEKRNTTLWYDGNFVRCWNVRWQAPFKATVFDELFTRPWRSHPVRGG